MENFASRKMERKETHHSVQDDNKEEGLECPVCLESYNEGVHMPKMMPCLHTLCVSCIVSLTSTVTNKNATLLSTSRSSFQLGGNVMEGSRQHPPLRRVTRQGLTISPPTTPTPSATNLLQFPPLSSIPLINPFEPQEITLETLIRRSANYNDFASLYTTFHPFTRNTQQANTLQPQHPPSPLHPQPSSSCPKPNAPPLSPEPRIPSNVVFKCPVCRLDINTNKLQTNRYILAHMRDLARLSEHSPMISFDSPSPDNLTLTPTKEPTSQSKPSKNLWCEDCKQAATSACTNHKCMPISEWVVISRATLESLQMEVESKLGSHTAYLQNLDKIMNDIYDSLNKASRCVFKANKQVESLKEEMKNQVTIPTANNSTKMAEILTKKVTQMEALAKRVSEDELQLMGGNEVTVTLGPSLKEVSIRTKNPNQLLTLSIEPSRCNV